MKKSNFFKVAFAAISALGLLLVGCNGGGGGGGGKGVSLSQKSVEMFEGDIINLTATAAADATIEWAVSDAEIISVKGENQTGVVTALKEGSAQVTATVGSDVAKCDVTVKKVVLTLDKTTASVNKGDTLQLNATCNATGALSWYSSDESVATVSSSGLVTTVMDGECDITVRYKRATEAVCHLTVVWADKPVDYYEITWSEEGSITNDAKFYYWNDQNWVGSDVTVEEAVFQNGAATFKYSGSTAVFYGMQVFYKDANIPANQDYHMHTEITAEVAGRLTINGVIFSLNAGKNDIDLYAKSRATTLSIQCGVNSNPPELMEANTLTIKKPEFTAYTPSALQAPTALSIAADKTVTITDANQGHNNGYKLAFCNASGAVLYSQVLQNGDKIDDSKFASGNYDVKVLACAKNEYSDSPYSGVLAQFKVADKSLEYDLEWATAADGQANFGAGVFFYWSEWYGLKNAHYKDGEVTFIIDDGGFWYSNQIFYFDSHLTQGTAYKLHIKIETDINDSITLNNNVLELHEGVNEFDIDFTQRGGPNASISLAVGVNTGEEYAATTISNGTFRLFDMYFHGDNLPEPVYIGKGGDSPEETKIALDFSGEADLAEADKVVYWKADAVTADGESCYLDGDGNIHIAWSGNSTDWWGFQLFMKKANIEKNSDYLITCTINAKQAMNVTLSGKVVNLKAGDNEVELGVKSANNNNELKTVLSFQAGVNGVGPVEAGELVIKNYAYKQYTPVPYAAPTAVAIAADGTVSVTGEGQTFGIFFFLNDQLLYSENVANGDKIDTSSFAKGSYKIRARANEAGAHQASLLSGDIGTFVKADGSESYEIAMIAGNQNNAVANPGKYIYNAGTGTTVSAAKLTNDGVSFSVSGQPTATSDFGKCAQLWVKNPSNVDSTRYKMTVVIESEGDCGLMINNQAKLLTAGENTIEWTGNENQYYSFWIRFGTNNANFPTAENVSIVIKSVTFEAA